MQKLVLYYIYYESGCTETEWETLIESENVANEYICITLFNRISETQYYFSGPPSLQPRES
jgi:hypothetical protein